MKNYEKLKQFLAEREKEGIKFEFFNSTPQSSSTATQDGPTQQQLLSRAILSIHGPILGFFYILTHLLLRQWILSTLCGLIVTKTTSENRKEIIAYTLGHSFRYFGWKYLIFSLIGVRKSYRNQCYATNMVEYLLYHQRTQLPYSEVDVFLSSHINGYNSPVCFLCERAQLHVLHFSQQLAWWRCSYFLSLLLIPHLHPGFFVRGRFMQKPVETTENATTPRTTTTTRTDLKYHIRKFGGWLWSGGIRKLFAVGNSQPSDRRRARNIFSVSDSHGIFSFILATTFSVVCVFIGKCIVNGGYRKKSIISKVATNQFQLISHQIEDFEEHNLIISFLYLDVIVAVVFSIAFPVAKFFLHNMSSFLIRKKFLMFRTFELAVLFLFPISIFTGISIMSPFIGAYFSFNPKYNYSTPQGKTSTLLVRFPFLILLYSIMIMVSIPQLLIRYQGVVQLKEAVQDDWFIWFTYLGFYAAIYTFYESICYIPGSFCYHAFERKWWIGVVVVGIGLVLEFAFFFGLQRWL